MRPYSDNFKQVTDYIPTVSPRHWRVVVESPDKLATLTKTNIFMEDAQIQTWAEELKGIIVNESGSSFGSLTTCFFSDCCGYEYTNKRVSPTRIPPVLFKMLSKLMPACGIICESRWPTGINVNYYPDGYVFNLAL